MGAPTCNLAYIFFSRFTKYYATRAVFLLLDPMGEFCRSVGGNSLGAVLLTTFLPADLMDPLVRAAMLAVMHDNQIAARGMYNPIGRRNAFLAYHATLLSGLDMLAKLIVDKDLLKVQAAWLKGV